MCMSLRAKIECLDVPINYVQNILILLIIVYVGGRRVFWEFGVPCLSLTTRFTTFSCGCKSIIKFHQTSTQPHTPILVLALQELARAQLPLHPSLGLVAVSLSLLVHVWV